MLSTLSSDRASALDSPVLEVQAMTLEQQVIALEKQPCLSACHPNLKGQP